MESAEFLMSPPPQLSTRKSSQTDFSPATTTMDESQDWTQWMRWDDHSLPAPVKNESQSPFESSYLTPASLNLNPTNSDQTRQQRLPSGPFTPDIPFDFMNFQFDPPLDQSPPATAGVSPPFDTQSRPSISTTVSTQPPPPRAARKRKTSSDDDDDDQISPGATANNGEPPKKVPSKKRAHNVIEKRYRANLNDKIAELRDSIPSLRSFAKQQSNNNNNNNGGLDDDDGASGNKMNKASILSKATEYIRHLEIRNKRLEEENTALKNRLRETDKVVDQNATSAASVSSPSNYTLSSESRGSSSPSVFSNPADDTASEGSSASASYPSEGLIKVPDAFKRMRAQAARSGSYAESFVRPQSGTGNDSSASTSGRRSNLPNKYMLGALAGLMVLEGVGSEKKTESTAKGLLAVPVNQLSHLFNYFINQSPKFRYWHAVLRNFFFSWQAMVLAHFVVLAILVVGSAFLVFIYLFNSQPSRQSDYSVKPTPATDEALSVPYNFRRQAWLTSIQQVGVPRHRFFREWYAVTSRCFEYLFRCMFGWDLYSWATGVTEEDEKGRVKTWDIAIDAQLSGGDTEISKSRLVLTIFAAGTLPHSPSRTMLKSLHCRILLWRVGETGSWTFNVSNDIARALAKYQWELARKMNASLPEGHEEALPPHLAALLEIDCEDVMVDSIVQRAANFTWNRPTQEGADDDEALLDVVEDDPAIQSSLDALASWWSSHLLQRAILRYFEASSGGPASHQSRDRFKAKIKLALKVAPQPSAAHTRALVMRAIFFDQGRVDNIGQVLAALPYDRSTAKGSTVQRTSINLVDSSLPVSVREEVSIAVRCAMIAAIFKARRTGDTTTLPGFLTIDRATAWFNQLPVNPIELTLIGFAAMFHLLHVLALPSDGSAAGDLSSSSASSTPDSSSSSCGESSHEGVTRIGGQECALPDVGRVASELVYWARHAYNPAFYGVTPEHVNVIEDECRKLCDKAGATVEDIASTQQASLKSTKKRRQRKKKKASRNASPISVPL